MRRQASYATFPKVTWFARCGDGKPAWTLNSSHYANIWVRPWAGCTWGMDPVRNKMDKISSFTERRVRLAWLWDAIYRLKREWEGDTHPKSQGKDCAGRGNQGGESELTHGVIWTLGSHCIKGKVTYSRVRERGMGWMAWALQGIVKRWNSFRGLWEATTGF